MQPLAVVTAPLPILGPTLFDDREGALVSKITVFTRLNAAASDRRLSAAHFRMFYVITQNMNGKKSQKMFAHFVGIDQRRVRRLIDDLVRFGYLSVEEGCGSGKKSQYKYPENGINRPPSEDEKRGHSTAQKSGQNRQRKEGLFDAEKGAVGADTLRNLHPDNNRNSNGRAAPTADTLTEEEQRRREETKRMEERRTAGLSEQEKEKRLRKVYYMVLAPWKERGRLSDRQFRDGWKAFTEVYDSGAASLTVMVSAVRDLTAPLPDPADYLRSLLRAAASIAIN